MRNDIFFILLFLLTISCTWNDVTVEDYRNDNASIAKDIIHFYPRINGFASGGEGNITPFPVDCRAQIFAFVRGIQLTQWRYYQSFSAGSLTPVEQPMELVNGSYDFYMVSTKSSSNPPVFHEGNATGLVNGVDYLWYGMKAQIEQSHVNLPINFVHSASQIVIQVSNAPGETVAEWIQFAMMASPKPSSSTTWNLFTGVINPVTELDDDSLINMAANGLMCQQIILPFSDESEIYVYLNMKINQENQYRGYPLELPVPDESFLPGHSYHYDVEFVNDTVLVGNVNIAPWIEVDEYGNPLYPVYD